MCGITGFLDSTPGQLAGRRVVLQNMTDMLAHRGPDADGIYQSPDGVVNLGHRRLAIIDLSSAGAQPMHTPDGRYSLCYNGEIYNFAELRQTLTAAGERFRGTSDTEVLLVALARWGMATTLPKLNGMFALALWDERVRKLYLARDRFGEKPLYYAWHNGVLLFGSELKALGRHPAFRKEINREALALFMRFNYVPTPHCIFVNAWKLPAGHYLTVSPGEAPAASVAYWQLHDLAANRQLLTMDAADPALIQMLDDQMRRAVKMRMVSDVPLGAFLSGGIDSSAIVAMMQSQSTRPVKTFTIGFWDTNYNEADDASKVARHLGTEHHEFYVSSRECLEVIERLPQIYDEPFADSSQIPTTLVSQFTRKHVSVALTGDCGDEFFGGYNRYFWSKRIWPKLQRLPLKIRANLANLINRGSPADWDRIFNLTNQILPSKLRVRGAGEKLHKLAAAMNAATPDDLYRSFVSQWQHPGDVLLSNSEPEFIEKQIAAVPSNLGYVERMMYLDMMTYMTDDILCKVDRASMSTGLEARVPFLDNDLVSLAWSMPIDVRIHNGIGKWPLRQVLKKYVPQKLFVRPKAGFGIPIGDWMRGPLREWTEDMLSESSLQLGGHFRPEVVRKQWAEHLSGSFNRQHSLWGVLMFEAWRREHI
jgi:asparagine synthase (glutamine-hydrolysing)